MVKKKRTRGNRRKILLLYVKEMQEEINDTIIQDRLDSDLETARTLWSEKLPWLRKYGSEDWKKLSSIQLKKVKVLVLSKYKK